MFVSRVLIAAVCGALVLGAVSLQAQAKNKSPAARQAPTTPYAHHPQAQSWAQDLADRWDMPAPWLRTQLARAQRIPRIEQLVLPAPHPSAKNWQAYRARFVEPRRIDAGLAFWQRHEQALARAEQQYGVPAAVVVGILGVETFYGQHMGTYRVLDALATLAFDFPAAHPRAAQRQAFFQNELAEFLRLHHRAGTDPQQTRGSYAGAMGWPQFMPSSWRQWAVDFDGDGVIDLVRSPVDAIGSVAHYLAAFGWQTGQPTHFPVQVQAQGAELATLLAPDIVPTFTAGQMHHLGALLPESAQQHPGPLALVLLHNGPAAPTHVAGTQNFYVVTRYNWSSYYALAVIELGQAVAAQREGR